MPDSCCKNTDLDLRIILAGTKSLDCLVDETWLLLQQVLVVGERVMLKVKSGGKS